MSVMLETTLGSVVVDLYTKDCPIAAKNFLKLCKIKYYNNVLVFNVQQNFIIQTGDPTGTGKGGSSVYSFLYGEQAKYFEDEIHEHIKPNRKGLVLMANSGANTNGSQFFITARDDDLEHLEGKHTIFGEIAEGLEVVDAINELYCDTEGRPYQDIRINHTYILEDPFDDPPGLDIPDQSPVRQRPEEEQVAPRLTAGDLKDENEGRTAEEIEKSLREKEAKSRAVVLEMIGDLPDADIKPPEDVLFVCKLNPVTTDEDLETIFSRFGNIKKAEIIKDFVTGDSLCYGFVEFDNTESCAEAYFKMNNVLIDDRRIKVDFSQSVSKLWNSYNRKENMSSKSYDPSRDNDNNGQHRRGSGRSGDTVQLKGKYADRHGSGRSQYEILSEEDDDRAQTKRRRADRSHHRRDERRSEERHNQRRDHKSRDDGERGRGSDRERNRHSTHDEGNKNSRHESERYKERRSNKDDRGSRYRSRSNDRRRHR